MIYFMSFETLKKFDGFQINVHTLRVDEASSARLASGISYLASEAWHPVSEIWHLKGQAGLKSAIFAITIAYA